ncbi:MAG: glycosyltransferase family 25 protein [Holosporaceae bacterium]|jgi:glycosyl transferase family 25|nr:glycosyltransferase family 25 protein [Holosporaceae bacterium]
MPRVIVLICVLFCFKIDALIYDAVYVINLDRNPERMHKMQKQLYQLGIKFIRFRAVDGYNLKIINAETGKIENNKSFHKVCNKDDEYWIHCGYMSIKYRRIGNRRALCCGEFGCALSHLSIMKDIIKHNYRSAIIFEDDISFENDFKTTLEATLKNTPNNVDILFLDVGIPYDYSSPYFVSPKALLRFFEQIPNNTHIVKLNSENNGNVSSFGAYAYVITYNGAKKVLESSKLLEFPIDVQIMANKNLFQYVARKKMLYVADEKSEIHIMGRGFSTTRNDFLVDGKRQ